MLKNLTLPEWLAFFRIITFPLMLGLIFILEQSHYAILYITFFATDVLDGLAAFLLKNDSDRREILDTWGDNLYMIAGTVAFWYYEPVFFKEHLILIVLVYSVYTLELILSIRKFSKPSNFHNYAAKGAAASQFLFLATLLLTEPVKLLFYLAVVLSFVDVLDELLILKKIRKWRTHVKGFWDA